MLLLCAEPKANGRRAAFLTPILSQTPSHGTFRKPSKSKYQLQIEMMFTGNGDWAGHWFRLEDVWSAPPSQTCSHSDRLHLNFSRMVLRSQCHNFKVNNRINQWILGSFISFMFFFENPFSCMFHGMECTWCAHRLHFQRGARHVHFVLCIVFSSQHCGHRERGVTPDRPKATKWCKQPKTTIKDNEITPMTAYSNHLY